MNSEMVLEARNITKSFGGTGRTIEVLKGIDLAVASGEVIMILGASGAGKSTLLNILGTLDRPDGGTLQVRGSDLRAVQGPELDRLRNRTIGFIFQFHLLLPEFTALENVMMPRLIGHEDSTAARAEAEGWLDRVGLAGRLNHKPAELSGGEQQRVAVARALINDPDVVLADEPTGNLDDTTSESIHRLILELSESHGKAFVVVTHKKELDAFSNRALLLEDGRLRPL